MIASGKHIKQGQEPGIIASGALVFLVIMAGLFLIFGGGFAFYFIALMLEPAQ